MRRGEFSLDAPRIRRKPSLTPMIDVVFLLLVFFMLAARFGLDSAIPLTPAASGGGGYTGAPRLVTVGPDGVKLNGAATSTEVIASQLRLLMQNDNDIVVVRAADGATLQHVVDIMD
ncbi:MAG: biopolymer transporter ExbD, partial [Pseudomonadota bacterium]